MCGIAGFINLKERTAGIADLRRMMESIAHRGPDKDGVYEDGTAFLGHQRLSIIDVASGHQPMANETATVHLIYNGEIFNHARSRPELERAGHRYNTHCDTETILHAYEEYRRGLRDTLPRHVRIRDLGRRSTDTFLRSRPAGNQAASTTTRTGECSFSRPRSRRCCEHPEISAEFDDELVRRVLGVRLYERRRDNVLAASAS